MPSDLSLFAQAILKEALVTGFGIAVVVIVVVEKFVGYPVLASRCARELLAVRRFWQQLPQTIAGKATNGNRVGQTRTAQRRVDDLTNTAAPWVRVEAPRQDAA